MNIIQHAAACPYPALLVVFFVLVFIIRSHRVPFCIVRKKTGRRIPSYPLTHRHCDCSQRQRQQHHDSITHGASSLPFPPCAKERRWELYHKRQRETERERPGFRGVKRRSSPQVPPCVQIASTIRGVRDTPVPNDKWRSLPRQKTLYNTTCEQSAR